MKDKIIKFFEKGGPYSEEKGNHLGLYIDTETTGLDNDAEIWEIAILPFSFNDDGQICQVYKPYVGREEPTKRLPPEIESLCNVKHEDLVGRSFDDGEVLSLFSKAELAVAHNAKFDRPKIHSRFPMIKNINWGCSAFDPDWESVHINTRTLDYLAFKYGFWFEHHGALSDCRAGLHILTQNLTEDETVFQSLLKKAFTPASILELTSNFSSKDLIKSRGGYRWDPNKKVWKKTFSSEEALDEDLMFFQERDPSISTTITSESILKRFL